MSSPFHDNPAASDSALLLPVENPLQHLETSLKKITQEYPPRGSYNARECLGLYSGPTSIAYLFLKLDQYMPELKVLGHRPRYWAKAYLFGVRPESALSVSADYNGVINEKLAYHAVRIALHQKMEDLRILLEGIREAALGHPK